MKKNCLFVGNPGAGKSTMLNCLMKSRKPTLSGDDFFKSGVSIGEGMTFQFDDKTVDDTTYMDTPGLEDTVLREQAAKAISEALKQSGRYQVVFVVTLESGRVRPQDVTVINLVLNSAPEINRYGVIFNKLTKGIIQALDKKEENRNKLVTQVSLQTNDNSSRPVPIPLFLPKMLDLEDLDDVTTDVSELVEFMPMVPFLEIHADKVEDIEIDQFERYSKQLEAQLTELKNSNEQMAVRMQKDKEEYEKRMKEIIEEDKRRHAEEMKRIQEQNEKQMAMLQEKEREHREQMQERYKNDAESHALALAKMQENFKNEREQMARNQQEAQTNQNRMFQQMQEQNAKQMAMMNRGGPGICSIS